MAHQNHVLPAPDLLCVEQFQQPGHSSGLKIPRLGSYLCKTSPTIPQQAGMTFDFVLYNPPHQFSEKTSPCITCTKQHKFLANNNDFSIGPEVHLKVWHLLLCIFKEAGFSNPHLNTTEKPVCFFPGSPCCVLSLWETAKTSLRRLLFCSKRPKSINQSVTWQSRKRRLGLSRQIINTIPSINFSGMG